uniref:Uncharacterized protein n=1 Tax=Aegilops tauschii subsp. strangulata TaxID=200361 RepID=A0A453GV42_AEGTS
MLRHLEPAVEIWCLSGHASDHGDTRRTAKPGDLAVGGKDVGGDVGRGAAHNWHVGADTELVDIVGAVGLAKHTVDIVGEAVELEADVEVREAVILGYAVVVDAGVLLCDGHHIGQDVEHSLELDPDAVSCGTPCDGQCGHGGGLPLGVDCGGDFDGHVVEGQLEAVDVAVPLDGLLGAHVEAMVSEADAEGLDPGEVAAHGGVALPDEVGVDLEIGVGDHTKALVLFAVEVEVVAISAREARVPAGYSRVEVAHAVGFAAWAHDDALVGAALVAVGDAGAVAVLCVVAGEHLVPPPEPPRVDHVGVLRQPLLALGGGRHGGRAQEHQHRRGGDHTHGHGRCPRHLAQTELAE